MGAGKRFAGAGKQGGQLKQADVLRKGTRLGDVQIGLPRMKVPGLRKSKDAGFGIKRGQFGDRIAY